LPSIDVVPVNPDTVDEWEYPPYSGHYDGTLSLNFGDMGIDDLLQERGSGDVAVPTTRADSSEYCEFTPIGYPSPFLK
jgi:hypothetical protein